MGLNIRIEYESQLDELIQAYKELAFLKKVMIHEDSCIAWQRKQGVTYDIQVIFIGKTGYGKSSTLNGIIGKDVFKTDDVASCTKRLHSAEYRIHEDKPYYFSLCDLPGVGESKEADEQYLEWYRSILLKSNCVVYVLRADQRDFSVDEKVFKDLFRTASEKRKVILALNYADKIEPINRKSPFSPSEAQLKNLNEKVYTISGLFDIPKSNILFYSAVERYNLHELVLQISNVVKSQYQDVNPVFTK